MNTRKLTLGIIAALYGAASAHAADSAPSQFIYKPFGVNPVGEAVAPDWTVVNQQYTPWMNDGNVFNCSAWSPPVNLVNLDEDFTQTRTCSQSQARLRTDELKSERLNQTRFDGPYPESRVISVEESQEAIGTRDFITGVREDSWPSWDRVGGFYGCDSWTPEPSTIDYGTSFTQERDCSWDEGRYRDVFNTWQSGIETYLRTDSDARTVPYIDTQPSVGTYRDWQPTTSTFTTWVDIGEDYAHSSWSPAPVAQTSDFTQSRDYKRDQERYEQFREQDRITSDIRNTGVPVLRSQTVDRDESRSVATNFTAWEEVARSGHTSWAPVPTTQTANFNQSRSYTSEQERERYYNASGDGELNRVTETRDVESQSESRSVVVSYSEWSEVGGNYDCGAWGPLPETVAFDEEYTQSRQCKQNETRDRIYTADSTELDRVEESRTLTPTQTRSQTGVGTWEPTSSTYTPWSTDETENYGHSGWLPRATNQLSDYQQINSYKRDQKRTETFREKDVHSDAIRETGDTQVHTETLNLQHQRTVTVDLGTWVNQARTNITDWSPLPTTQTAAFEQVRTYSQPQVRDVTHSVDWQDEGIIKAFEDTRTLTNQPESRTVTVSWTDWVNEGEYYDCSEYTNQVYVWKTNYYQYRSCNQDQTRDRVYSTGEVVSESKTVKEDDVREVNVSSGDWVNVSTTDWAGWTPSSGSQVSGYTQTNSYTQLQRRVWTYKTGGVTLATRDEDRSLTNQSKSRTVAVTNAASAFGEGYDFGTWTPAANSQTTSFTQTRPYSKDRTRTYTHKAGGSTVHTNAVTETTDSFSQSRTVTVSWTDWSDTGGLYSCGSYDNTANTQTSNFIQTRSCKQNQTRTRNYSSGESKTETRTINVDDSRNVTVSVGSYSNLSTNGHSSWSPAFGIQYSDYTQTRSYNQVQRRVWTYKADGSTIHTRNQDKTLSNQSESRHVDVSRVVGSYTGSEWGHTEWTPMASAQTSTFTQSRDYKKTRNLTFNHTVGGAIVYSHDTVDAVDDTETRTVTVSWTGWANDGAIYSCGSYNNTANTQTSNFTQTRSCKQNQKRTRNYSSGESKSESRTINVNDSRTITVSVGSYSNLSTNGHSAYSPAYGSQTSNYTQSRTYNQVQRRLWTYKAGSTTIHTRNDDRTLSGQSQSRTVTVTNSAGSYGAGHSYGSWSPTPTTQTSSFTQNRSYKKNRTRTYTHKVGSTTVHTKGVTEIDSFNESRTVTVSWSGWSNSGGVHSCGNYDIAPVNQTSNYTQTRSCKQKQTRTRNYSSGESKVEARDINVSDSRLVTVTSSAGSYGSNYGYGTWSPTPTTQTSSFTQNRSYKRDRTRTYTHSVGGTAAYSQNVTETGNFNQSRTVTVSWSGWSNSGGLYSCGSYNNTASTQTSNFTQTRSCKQNQTRTRNYSSGESKSESRTINVNDSRTVTVSVGSYYNLSTNGHSSYSPAYGSQTSNYTQSRTYNQVQRRVWTYKVGSSTIHTRNQDRTLSSQSQSRTVTVTNSAGSYGSAHTYGSWTPTPSSQTSNFTQNRSYKKSRTRTYTHKVGSTTVHTRGVTETANYNQSRTIAVSWSSYSNNGSASCGSWSQNSSTGAKTRSCSQPEKRTRYYKSGSSTIKSVTETRNRSYTDSVTVTGTTYGSWSGYSNYGSYHSCSGYSPSPSTVASGTKFTQSRSCKQPQRRSRAKYNTLSDGSNFRTGTDYGTRTINVTQYKYNVSGTKVVEQCSSGGYYNYESSGYDYETEYEEYKYNGTLIYSYSYSDSERGGSSRDYTGSLTQGGYRYYAKNIVASNGGYPREGDVCRVPE